MRTFQIFLRLKFQEITELFFGEATVKMYKYVSLFLLSVLIGATIIGSIILGFLHSSNLVYSNNFIALAVDSLPRYHFLFQSTFLGMQILSIGTLIVSLYFIFKGIGEFFQENWEEAKLIVVKERQNGR